MATRDQVISAFITCYNHGEYVAEAIESLKAQALPPKQIILIDDGSTDNSADVMGAAVSKGVEFHQRPHLGHIAQYNWAIKKCKGDFIHLMAADDVLLDRFFYANCLELFNPTVGFVSGGLIRITPDGQKTKLRFWPPNDCYGRVPRTLVLQRLAEHGNFVNGGATLCRRVALRNIGDEPYDPKFPYAADFLLWVRLLARGWNAAFIAGDCYGYRAHSSQMTATTRAPTTELELIYRELQAALNQSNIATSTAKINPST